MPQISPPKLKPAAASRWRRRGISALLFLAVLAFFAPSIIARTPLRQWILAPVDSQLVGTVEVGRLSLGWFSPVAASDVVLRHSSGQPVAEIPRLATDKSLWSILIRPSSLGRISVEQPVLHLALRPDGSNLEDMLEHILSSPETEPSETSMEIVVQGGRISIQGTRDAKPWQYEDVDLTVQVSGGTGGSINVEGALGTLVDRPKSEVKVSVVWPRREGKGACSLRVVDLPVELAKTFAERAGSQIDGTGAISADLEAEVIMSSDKPASFSVSGQIAAAALSLQTPQIAPDRITLASLNAPCRLSYDGHRLSVERLSIECDVGSISLEGTFQPGMLSIDNSLAGQDLRCQGRLNIARLAALLPYTMHLRAGTQVESGEIGWSLEAKPSADDVLVSGSCTASNLVATRQGTQIVWREPISATLAGRFGKSGPRLDSLDLRSTFMRVTGQGNLDDLSISLACDLGQLAVELDRFIDTSGLKLAGAGEVNIRWRKVSESGFQATGGFHIDNLVVGSASAPAWNERRVSGDFSASGQLQGTRLWSVDMAQLKLLAPPDELAVTLVERITEPSLQSTWPAKVRLVTSLARAEAAAKSHGLDRLSGTLEADGSIRYSDSSIEVENVSGKIHNLILATPTWGVHEPLVTWGFSGRTNSANRKFQLARLAAQAQSLQIDASDIDVDYSGPFPTLASGRAAITGDLSRIQKLAAPANAGAATTWAGQLRADATVASEDGGLVYDVSALLDNFSPALDPRNPRAAYRDRIAVQARAKNDSAKKRLELRQLDLSSNFARIKAQGSLDHNDPLLRLALNGELEYDLSQAAPYLRNRFGDDVQITGRGRRAFRWDGPLASSSTAPQAAPWYAAAAAEAGLGWDSATLFALPVEKGELSAVLAKGTLTVKPIDLPIGGGNLLLAPRVDLWPAPGQVTLPGGPIVQRVNLTPEVCKSAMRYVTPLLAEVTTASGQVSADLVRFRVPLDNPGKGDIEGRLQFQQSQASPGPLVQQILTAIQPLGLFRGPDDRPLSDLSQIKVVAISDQNIDFLLREGRIYHRGFELKVANAIRIRTEGSVGSDETMAVMVSLLINTPGLGNRPILSAALSDRGIQIPVGGTLRKPEIDLRQVLQQSTGNLIQEGIGRQLDRLIGR